MFLSRQQKAQFGKFNKLRAVLSLLPRDPTARNHAVQLVLVGFTLLLPACLASSQLTVRLRCEILEETKVV